jgi:ubiquinol-cytochrome c reductase cytochrome b subunit
MKIGDWLDERTGYRALVKHALEEPVPGGARWAYVFGSCLVVVLLIQAGTGVVMASCYSPSTTDAWASVAYLQDRMWLGWFVRGLHSAGASAMIVLLLLHMLQVTIWGAYKKPREVNWLLGVILLTLVLGFALTGYLLPWDQKGYWATQVATSLLGATPLVGHALQRLVQGGPGYGNLTLTRFYSLHVFVLPATVFVVTVAHVALFRKHGITPSWKQSADELERKKVLFWPDQLLRDAVAVALVVGLMVWSVLRTHGAELEAPADPTSSYDARPEWYFLPLFQLLKLFPGRLEIPAAIGVPTLVIGTLVLLPFFDRGAERAPQRRKKFIAAVVLILVGAVELGVSAWRDDARSEAYQAKVKRATAEAEHARKLAEEGVPVAGGLAVLENDPHHRAQKLFGERCAGCHRMNGAGENRAPDLDGWGSRAWFAGMLKDPDSDGKYGKTEIRGMKPVDAPPEDSAALVEYLYSFGGGPVDEAKKARGATLWKERDCDECHETDGTSQAAAPNFARYGSKEWLKEFLTDPGTPTNFGRKNKMPKFGERLSPAEIETLADLLSEQRNKK